MTTLQLIQKLPQEIKQIIFLYNSYVPFDKKDFLVSFSNYENRIAEDIIYLLFDNVLNVRMVYRNRFIMVYSVLLLFMVLIF